MSQKYAAKGWLFKYAASATPTTTIDGLRRLRFKQGDRVLLDTSDHATSAVKTSIPAALREANEVVATFLYDPADTIHELVRAHHSAGTKGFGTVVAPDTGAAQWAHSGYVTTWEIADQDPETGLLEVEISYKADGADTFTQ
jgi:hypothetical protein